jgi:hypothetical protein
LLPGLTLPSWFAGTGAYNDSLTNGLPSPGTWELLLLANLVDKNPNGLNDLLDTVLSSVFGAAFDEAAGRAGSLSYSDSFAVDEKVLKALGLWEVFEGDDIYIGRAELDLLFSALRVLKASLEWISAYDWNTDVSFLRTEWKDIDGRIDQLTPANLPFRNNFLKSRNNGSERMGRSKASYIAAIDTAIAAYDSMIANSTGNLPPGAVDTLNEFGWIRAGLAQLKTAINSGGNFYVKEGSGTTYSNTSSGADFGINLGKFFTPGQFAANKLITTEGSGNTIAPKFFGMQDEDTGVAISNKGQIGGYEMIGFQFNPAPLEEVFFYGFNFPKNNVYIPVFPADIAEPLYGLYHK